MRAYAKLRVASRLTSFSLALEPEVGKDSLPSGFARYPFIDQPERDDKQPSERELTVPEPESNQGHRFVGMRRSNTQDYNLMSEEHCPRSSLAATPLWQVFSSVTQPSAVVKYMFASPIRS